MIRNLRVLVAAALALTAFGAISTTGAQAAHEFHCSVSPCTLTARADGTGSTAHQVFIIENAAKTEAISFTCHGISGHGLLTGNTTNAITISSAYTNCTINGSPGIVWDMNGCNYKVTGGVAGTTDAAETHLECEAGKNIQMTIGGGCTIEIGPQTLPGVGYHTLGTTPNREITVTMKNVGPIATTATAACAPLINPNQTLIGTWTTGNFILTGETTPGVMADAWFL